MSPTEALCPVCVETPAGLIDPYCPVCGGHGTVLLHPAALSMYAPAVVAQAVDLSVTRAAKSGRPLPEVIAELADAVAIWAREPVQVIEAPLVCSRPPLGRRGKRRRRR